MKKTLFFLAILIFPMLLQAQNTQYWERKVSLYDRLPIGPDDIVFLGNSITDGGNWEELFGRTDVKNRGISGDIIPGVMKRLDQVTSGHPRKIFLLIGINDISHKHSVDTLAARYTRLVKEIRRRSPQTRLYLQSVMPIDNDFNVYKNLKGEQEKVPQLNSRIRAIARQEGLTYIDLWPILADEKGKLNSRFTNDGLHLTGAGYRAWADAIAPLLDE